MRKIYLHAIGRLLRRAWVKALGCPYVLWLAPSLLTYYFPEPTYWISMCTLIFMGCHIFGFLLVRTYHLIQMEVNKMEERNK